MELNSIMAQTVVLLYGNALLPDHFERITKTYVRWALSLLQTATVYYLKNHQILVGLSCEGDGLAHAKCH